MKKNYLKPEASQLNILIENIMQITSTPVNNEEENDQNKFSTGNNRGEWGNIWGK